MAIVKNRRTGRTEIVNPFMGQSLEDRDLMDSTQGGPVIRILPDVHVLKIGGQSIMDRGRPAVYPILKEIVKCHRKYQMLLTVGGGTRARHAYNIALDLDLPTGVLAALGEAPPRQNARMLQMLLARHGGIYVMPDDFEKVSLYLNMKCIPIMSGMPPYDYWEKPAAVGRIPTNRTDSGTFLSAEFLGAKSLIYIKDEDGLYTADPKKDRKAKFIPRITVSEIYRRGLQDSIVEWIVLENMCNAQHIRRLQVINGLKPGNITKALAGKHVGTIIDAD